MKAPRLVFSLATGGLLMLLLTVLFLPATAGAANTETGHGRKVEIVSGGATQSDLHLNMLREFGSFERSHPAIARAFDRQPMLIRSKEFRSRHPEWATFLREHPAIEADIEANPGNYVVIRPGMASASWHRQEWMKTTRQKA
jgi:hypothetical protein